MISFPQDEKWVTWPIIGEEEERYLQLCLESGDWSRGKFIADFEEAFSNFCECKYTLLVNSGTDALTMALRAIGIGPGDEVIVPGLTWHSTAFSVLECGAKAIIVDIEPNTYGLSPQSVIENISQQTKAVVAVHLFNSTADLDKLLSITDNAGIALIEDASQAHGCQWKGKQVGTFGIAGVFSFQQKKLVTCGEGGCLVTNDDSLFRQAYELRDHGAVRQDSNIHRYGGNNRISGFNAAILMAQLSRLAQIVELEENSGKYLTERLNAIQGLTCLERRQSVTRQTFCSFCFKLSDLNYLNNIEEVRKNLSQTLGIPLSSTYPPLAEKSFFKPHLERRYQGLWQFRDLTNCYLANKESIRFPHQYLICSKRKLDEISEKIQETLYNFS